MIIHPIFQIHVHSQIHSNLEKELGGSETEGNARIELLIEHGSRAPPQVVQEGGGGTV